MNSTNIDHEQDVTSTPVNNVQEIASPIQPTGRSQVEDERMPSEDHSTSHENRWHLIVATLAGLLASVPLGWLLSNAAQLPFFLGLFFFPLFGLMIGAVMHRVLHRARPYGTWPLLVGTTIVVLFCWLLSLEIEARGMPVWVAAHASRNPRLKLKDQTIEAYRASVAEQARQFLRQSYPPGGMLGYVRWVSTNGVISRQVVPGLLRPIHAPQQGKWWLIRVALSVGLLAFGIGSQTLILRSPAAPVIVAS